MADFEGFAGVIQSGYSGAQDAASFGKMLADIEQTKFNKKKQALLWDQLTTQMEENKNFKEYMAKEAESVGMDRDVFMSLPTDKAVIMMKDHVSKKKAEAIKERKGHVLQQLPSVKGDSSEERFKSSLEVDLPQDISPIQGQVDMGVKAGQQYTTPIQQSIAEGDYSVKEVKEMLGGRTEAQIADDEAKRRDTAAKERIANKKLNDETPNFTKTDVYVSLNSEAGRLERAYKRTGNDADSAGVDVANEALDIAREAFENGKPISATEAKKIAKETIARQNRERKLSDIASELSGVEDEKQRMQLANQLLSDAGIDSLTPEENKAIMGIDTTRGVPAGTGGGVRGPVNPGVPRGASIRSALPKDRKKLMQGYQRMLSDPKYRARAEKKLPGIFAETKNALGIK